MSIFLILALLPGVVADDFELPPDIVLDTYTVSGTLLGFQAGEYMHAVIRDRNGDIMSVLSPDPLMDYFLAGHVGETVVLEVEEAETYAVEAEEMVRTTRLTGAAAGETTYEEWADSLNAEGTPEEQLGDYVLVPLDFLYGEEATPPEGGGR